MHRLLAAGFLGIFTAWAQPCSASGTLAEMLRFGSREDPPPLRERFVTPVLQVNFGALFSLPVSASPPLFFQLRGGALIGWPHKKEDSASAWLLPEVGYSHLAEQGGAAHLASLGVGAGYGRFGLAFLLYSPRFVVGQVGSDAAIGFRHGLIGYLFLSILSLELSHQVLSTGGMRRHDLLLSVGFNPLGVTPLARYLLGKS